MEDETIELFKELWESIPEFMDSENRQDAEFRAAVLGDQVGDLFRHISHDPELNEATRPLQEPEEVAYGDALWQLLCLAHTRDVDLDSAIEHALARMDSREGYKQTSEEEGQALNSWAPESDEIEGIVGEDILVIQEISPVDTVGIDTYDAVVTEIGGMSSHAAFVCREVETPFAVGVNGITDAKDGSKIRINFKEDIVNFEV